MTQLELLATAAFGLEAVVARELQSLGYESTTIQPGRLLFRGDESAVCRTNLWLRAADRVLVRMGTFEAADFGTLFDGVHALAWDEWLPRDAAFPVQGHSIKSQLSSVPAVQKIVKKAIVEKLKAAYGVETLDETGPEYTIEVGLLKDQATLAIDTSGPGLHKRGYRTLSGPAPLKETLAAAMILLTVWRPDRPLVDPFCGSGTIPIEAVLIGRNMAPGLNRAFAAEAWPRLPAELWHAAREEARDLVRPDLPLRVTGTDIDGEALRLARVHAQQAGVEGQVHFQHQAFADLHSTKESGCVIANPPYGERMGQRGEVAALYRAMPEVFRRLKTWSFYILTAHPDFEALVGQEADRRRKLYNGRIECTYYQFLGPKPALLAAARRAAREEPMPAAEGQAETAPAPAPEAPRPAFGGLPTRAGEQAEIFRSRLTKLARHLRKWPTKQGITCYRLYDRDVPEIPLVVDRYEDCLHMAEYDRPHEHTPAEHGDWLELMIRTAGEVLEAAPAKIFMKRRQRQTGLAQYERYASEESTFVVSEGGLHFEVNLSDYLDTGLFLDHRITRSMVRDLAAGKRFLNLFAYTGAFTVYAAAGGAKSTTTLDLSNTYLDWARRNMTLNGLTGPQHRFVRDDALGFLRHHPSQVTYDLAVVDPPTFSNSKKTDEFFDIQRDHVEMLNLLLDLMAPDGVVFFSTNFRRFKFAESEIPRARSIREISRQTVPPDFRNRRIHRCWRIVRGE
ncbi:MAG: bifunctional 23S rRNA (guanine(2069)-N(7))-methyltransferase RlmK/23S rRNA (guanine(2445)-N(2))-methyltransferase RlmL [Pirellulales bacterium]